jgi:hypothetical protein
VLQHDPDLPEDLDTNTEDHAADDCRYACSSRPWIKPAEPKEEPKDGYGPPKEPLDSSSSIKLL